MTDEDEVWVAMTVVVEARNVHVELFQNEEDARAYVEHSREIAREKVGLGTVFVNYEKAPVKDSFDPGEYNE